MTSNSDNDEVKMRLKKIESELRDLKSNINGNNFLRHPTWTIMNGVWWGILLHLLLNAILGVF